MYRLDHAYDKYGKLRGIHNFELNPSDYLRRQLWATFQDDPTGTFTYQFFGADQLLVGGSQAGAARAYDCGINCAATSRAAPRISRTSASDLARLSWLPRPTAAMVWETVPRLLTTGTATIITPAM